MIQEIVRLLKGQNLYNTSMEIEVAKGRFSIPKTVKESFTQINREFKYKTK
jgi:hypothetical protein